MAFLNLFIKFIVKIRWVFLNKSDVKHLLESISSGSDWTIRINDINEKYKLWKLLTRLTPNIAVRDGDTGPRDLRGLKLKAFIFENCSNIGNTHFEFVKFIDVRFKNCQINTSNFDYSILIGKKNSEFSNCKIHRISFKFSYIRNVEFIDCSGKEIDLINCQMIGCKYEQIDWIDVKMNDEYTLEPLFKIFLFSPVLSLFYLNKGTIIKRIIDPPKSVKNKYSFTTVLFNYDKIESFKRRNPIPALLLYITSNYGKNWKRFSFCIFLVWFSFGFIYSGFEIPLPGFSYEKPNFITIITPHFSWDDGSIYTFNELDKKLTNSFKPYYLSLVTITTLGAANIHPLDWKAQLYCCLESLLGYFFLSILAAAFFLKLRELKFISI